MARIIKSRGGRTAPIPNPTHAITPTKAIPGISKTPGNTALRVDKTRAQAASTPWRSERSTINPARKTPAATPNSNPVRAMFAQSCDRPCRFISALAVNAPNPPLATPYMMKKHRNKSTGGEKSNLNPICLGSVVSREDVEGAAFSEFNAWPRTAITDHTTTPTTPIMMKAGRHPNMPASANITGGAHAVPRKPKNVCVEKARPIRESSILPDRIA